MTGGTGTTDAVSRSTSGAVLSPAIEGQGGVQRCKRGCSDAVGTGVGASRIDAVDPGIQWILATLARSTTYTMLVVNEAKLSAEQLARLWHWRLGHPAAKVPVIMSKKGLASEINVRHELQCRCPICVKAGFAKTHTPRNDIDYQLTVRKSCCWDGAQT